jgi:hypothetical protein
MLEKQTSLQLAIARFKELRQTHGHLPRNRTVDMVHQFHAAQVEMFNLAQVICMLTEPGIQLELDATRREIIEQIELNIKVPTGARVVTKRIASGHLLWSEFQLTPEIAVDPTITGNAVLFPYLRKLKALLRAQCGLVNTMVLR